MLPQGLLPPAAAPAPVAPAAAPEGTPSAAPISYRGDSAIPALLGRKPTTAEYLLLSSILKGGTMQVSDNGAGR
jgi:hypothetical protein